MKQSSLAIAIATAALFGTVNAASVSFHGYPFEAHVKTDNSQHLKEIQKNSRPYIYVREGQEYSIVVHNPLPVRCAVAITVDGLNTIDGKRTSAKNGQKWMMEPNGTITIRGWQTGKDALRRFVFKNENSTYANWKESRDNRPYTQNLGVIGAAFFWNSRELQLALNPPKPFEDAMKMRSSEESSYGSAPRAPSADGACASAAKKSATADKAERAGTGMGNREQNNVQEVEFTYDTGMYSNNDVLALFYEFAKRPPEPQPFDNEGEYTPEM